jgi:hypothetical protein
MENIILHIHRVLFPTELSGASWPGQLAYKDVTRSGMLLLYVLIVIFVLFLLVMYLDLEVFTLDLRPDLGKPSGISQAKLVVWEALRSVPSHVTKRGCGSVYF